MAADNTTEYKVIVDTEVTGGENMELLTRTISTSIGEFENLNEAIGKTQDTLGKLDPKKDAAKFKELSEELSTLKDRLKDTEIQSVRFTEALAAQPGIIGFVGQSLEGLRGTMKVFAANPIIAVLAGIVAAFLALKESLSRTEEGQAKLTKITEGFTKIMNGLFAVLEPIAMLFADLIGNLLSNEKVMNGLAKTVGVLTGVFTGLYGSLFAVGEFIVNTLINNFKILIGVAKGAGDVIAGVFTFDWDRITKGADAAFTAVKDGINGTIDNVKEMGKGIAKSVSDGFVAGSKSFTEGSKRLTEAEKKAAEEAEKLRKERAEEAKKLEEQRLKDVEAANKILTEAYLAGLEDRDKEIYKRGEKLNSDLAILEKGKQAKLTEALKAGNKDTTKIEEEFNANRLLILEGYNTDVAAINTKFDEEQKKKAEEKKQKELEIAKLLFDEAQLVNENRTAQLEQRYNREIALINEKEKMMLSVEGLTEEQRKQIRETATNERLSQQSARYDELIAVIDEKENIALSNLELTEAQKTKIVLDAQAERSAIEQTRLDDQLLGIDNELSLLTISFDRRRELIAQKEAELLQQEGLTQNQRTQIAQQAANEREAIDMAELEAKAELQTAYLDLAGQFGSFLKEIAGKNKKLAIAGVVVEQAAAIGKIVVNTAIANAKALAATPLTFGMPFIAINTISAGLSIASSIAAGVKAIQQINNSDSATSVSGGQPPKTASAAAPSAPSVGGGAAGIPQITGTGGQASPGSQIAQTIGAASNKPIKAYVVSGDVTSQQALDRRTTRAATFSGGTGG
jgi:hypothetical protein